MTDTDVLRKFLDNLPSEPCKIRPDPRLCKICVRLNKKVASRCPFSKIKLEEVKPFEEPMIEVIQAKEKVPVLEPITKPITHEPQPVATLEPIASRKKPVQTPPPPSPVTLEPEKTKPLPAPPTHPPSSPTLQPVPIPEPVPVKMEKRLTELKIFKRKKISICISIIPIIFGIILVGLGAYLYNIIESYPPRSLAPYNIAIIAGGLWIAVGLILTILSGVSKKDFLHPISIGLGTFGMIVGIAFIGFGYHLFLITEALSGVEPYYTNYNISAFIGICSIIIFLIILLYGFLCKK